MGADRVPGSGNIYQLNSPFRKNRMGQYVGNMRSEILFQRDKILCMISTLIFRRGQEHLSMAVSLLYWQLPIQRLFISVRINSFRKENWSKHRNFYPRQLTAWGMRSWVTRFSKLIPPNRLFIRSFRFVHSLQRVNLVFWPFFLLINTPSILLMKIRVLS